MGDLVMLFFMDQIVRQNSKVLKIWIAGGIFLTLRQAFRPLRSMLRSSN